MVQTIIVITALSWPCFAQEGNSTVMQSPYFSQGTSNPPETPAEVKKSKRKGKDLSPVQLEARMLEQVNHDRTALGLPTLKLDSALARLARELADDMATHDSFGHKTVDGLDVNQRAKRVDITCGIYENIGTESGPDSALQMVEDIERSFMDEPPDQPNHRFVLLHPKHVTIGIGIAKAKDRVVVVQDFTDVDPSVKLDP
jgi:uncharacterized protein YkwD